MAVKNNSKPKNIKELGFELARREKGRKQISIAQIRELLSILSDMTYDGAHRTSVLLYNNGKRRAKRRERDAKKGSK